MNHNNEIICSVCGNTLVKYYDNVTRVVRTTGGKRKMIKIPRFRCEICGHIQRDLPDYIFPYKQYEKEVIEGVTHADGITNAHLNVRLDISDHELKSLLHNKKII